MFDVLLDTTNLQTDYTLYAGILFGLTIKLLWIWKINDRYIHFTYSTSDMYLEASSPLLQMKHLMHGNTLLLWIIKYIRRRKENPSDDPDPSISTTLSYSY